MTRFILGAIIVSLLNGCAATQDGRSLCASKVNHAWERLNFSESQGFAGSLSYSKAAGLITAAKFQQSIERYDTCINQAERALTYVDASLKGE